MLRLHHHDSLLDEHIQALCEFPELVPESEFYSLQFTKIFLIQWDTWYEFCINITGDDPIFEISIQIKRLATTHDEITRSTQKLCEFSDSVKYDITYGIGDKNIHDLFEIFIGMCSTHSTTKFTKISL